MDENHFEVESKLTSSFNSSVRHLWPPPGVFHLNFGCVT